MDFNDNSLKLEFLSEAAEMLEDIESAFIEFEKNPSQEIIDRIFRLAHTIKGSALTVGFENLGSFAHIVEALLSKLRSREMVTTPEITDVLLRSNDALRHFVAALTHDNMAHFDTDDLSREIRSIIEDAGGFVEGTSSIAGAGFGFFDDEEPVNTQVVDQKPEKQYSKLWGRRIPRVLIVDDEDDTREVFQQILNNMNIQTITCVNGIEALDVLKKQRIDLIITDIRMPNMPGDEFVSRMPPGQKNIPIIFCSGYVARNDILRLFELGAFEFIEKPAPLNKLKIAIHNGLRAKFFSDAVVRLSALNFKSYMAVNKILRTVDPAQLAKIKVEKEQMEAYLDEIGAITNHLIHPDHKF